MTMPNFLIIGAAKSGTTALYNYLTQHPMVFMSRPKEPNFFAVVGEKLEFCNPDGTPALINKNRFRDIDAYHKIFDDVKDERAIGEASVLYLSHTKAAERIRKYVPNAKLIAILRNPVDAAYSAFLMTRGFGIEPFRDFHDALQDQERRIRNNCFDGVYLEPRFYYRHLTRYSSLFGREQLHIYLYDDFQDAPQQILKNIYQFLEVDDSFVPNSSIRINVSGVPKSMMLHQFLTGRTSPIVRRISPFLAQGVLRGFRNLRAWNLSKPPLSPELRMRLVEIFRQDILRLQDFTGHNLTHWLEEGVGEINTN